MGSLLPKSRIFRIFRARVSLIAQCVNNDETDVNSFTHLFQFSNETCIILVCLDCSFQNFCRHFKVKLSLGDKNPSIMHAVQLWQRHPAVIFVTEKI